MPLRPPMPRFPDADHRARLLAHCPELEPIFRRYAERGQMPGVAYGVIVDGELLFTHGFGVRRVDGDAVDADTVFRIASMTKSFTALAVIKLRDEGRLRLDEPAVTYVPELSGLVYPTADAPPIAVRHLLTMTPGWPQDDPWADRQLFRSDAWMSEFYRGGVAFSSPPGIGFEYSNAAYMVLGRIITRVSGTSAVDYIRRELLLPLGMTSTVWNAADLPADRLAHGYRWEDERWKEEPPLPTGGDVAAFAGLFTSVRDLARWVALFQSAWPPRDEPETGIVRRSSLREMQQIGSSWLAELTPTPIEAPSRVAAGGYGCGLSLMQHGAWASVGHGGGVPGFGSHMRWSPDHGVGLVALANVTYANVHAATADALEALIRESGAAPRQRRPAPALENARAGIVRLIEGWDDALADELFADNFFLDRDRPRWQRRLAELRELHGALRPEGPLAAENWLRGRWRMAGERGACEVWISLAPTVPPRVQALAIESTLPASPALAAAADRIAELTAHPRRRSLLRLLARSASGDPIWDRVRLAHILCGPCVVDELTSRDGARRATFRLVGPKGSLDAELALDAHGRVEDVVLRRPADSRSPMR